MQWHSMHASPSRTKKRRARPPRRTFATARYERKKERKSKRGGARGEEEGALTFYSKLSGVTTDQRPNRLLPRIEVHTYKKLLDCRIAPSSRRGGRKE